MTMSNVFTYFKKKIKTTSKVVKDKIIPQKLIPERPLDERPRKRVKAKINAFPSKTKVIFR
jgi:hypothetical protein